MDIRTRRIAIVAGVITVVVAVGTAFTVPQLVAAASPGTAAVSTPTAPATPVISATPVPEPGPRTALDGEMTVEQKMAIGEREGPRGTALNQVQEAHPDDFAYGYITDAGFGVGFKFDAPADALAVLDSVGDPYELHENVGFAEPDILPQVSRVSDIVQAAVPQGQTFSVSANPFTVTVEVELFSETADSGEYAAPEGASLQALLTEARAQLYPGFDVEITSRPGRIEAD